MVLCFCCMVTAVAAPQVNAQSNDILNRINRLENEIDTLNRAVYRGEKPDQMPTPMSAPSQGQNIEVRLQQMEKELRELTGRVEEQSFSLDQLERQLERQTPPPSAQGQQSMNTMQTPPTAGRGPVVEPSPVTGATQPPQPLGAQAQSETSAENGAEGTPENTLVDGAATEAYEQAFSYIKEGDFGQAEQAFKTFLETYPDNPLAANATYWLGETYYVRERYAEAARVFAEAYQKYPDGSKSADNLLKLGMSLASLDKKEDACVALQQIEIEYPDGPGPILRRAEMEMNNLGCAQ